MGLHRDGTTDERNGRDGQPSPADALLPRLYDDNVDEVYRYVYRRCLDRALAEDITHDVFISAIRHHHLAEVSTGWLIRAARNRLIDVVRRHQTHGRKVRLLADGMRVDRDDGATSVVARLSVERAMAELRHDHRVVLTLFYLDDLTVAELAEQLGRSRRGVESLLTRARAALRSALEEVG